MVIAHRYAIFFLSLMLITSHAYAEKVEQVTVNSLIEMGYKRLDHDGLKKLLSEKKIGVKDFETGEEFVVEIGAGDMEKDGNIESINSAKRSKMFDLDSMSKPVILRNAHYQLVGDTIIASEGVRQHRLSFYTKGKTIYGVRDVDAGRVYYKVLPVLGE